MRQTENPGSQLMAALISRLPRTVHAAGGLVRHAQGRLFDIEAAAVQRAVPSRQAQFRAGRTYARKALASLNIPEQPIPRAADRQPQWPDGIVGALTHTSELCAAIVAKHDDVLALGLDLEACAPLQPQLRQLIGRPDEQDGLARPLATEHGQIDGGLVTFSAKESLFKAYYPATGHLLRFQDASVSISPDGHFTIRLMADVPALNGLRLFHGSWTVVCDHMLTVLAVSRSASSGGNPSALGSVGRLGL